MARIIDLDEAAWEERPARAEPASKLDAVWEEAGWPCCAGDLGSASGLVSSSKAQSFGLGQTGAKRSFRVVCSSGCEWSWEAAVVGDGLSMRLAQDGRSVWELSLPAGLWDEDLSRSAFEASCGLRLGIAEESQTRQSEEF